MIFISDRQDQEYAAVFRERSDGDWDFVAMAGLQTFPMMSQADKEQAMAYLKSIAGAIAEEGDRALIEFFPDPNTPSVLVKDVNWITPQ